MKRPALKRAKLFEKQAGLCWLCDRLMVLKEPPRGSRAVSIDHFIPAASGGSDAFENLRGAHAACNFVRANLPPEEARKRIRALVDKHGPLYWRNSLKHL